MSLLLFILCVIYCNTPSQKRYSHSLDIYIYIYIYIYYSYVMLLRSVSEKWLFVTFYFKADELESQ